LAEVSNPCEEATGASSAYLDFAQRHGIESAPYLTVMDLETAALIAERLEPRISGKIVVEVGGGIGLLALAMGLVARRVYCIEANPMWSMTSAGFLLRTKPKNVSFLFGAADQFVDYIRADVGVVCTHSDVSGMMALAGQFAPQAIISA
jgi:protein-L-isoaspartate O-methyltransferase